MRHRSAARWIDNPNLSRVGFTDLTIGSGHGDGSSRIDWIEVCSNPVGR